ncbi:MAG TPA: Ig-like domain-containing protein, partial [Roseiflexaceae bacterium]|nr:Ig-like domain-containing protein [Roseiflexaceae bacterium]
MEFLTRPQQSAAPQPIAGPNTTPPSSGYIDQRTGAFVEGGTVNGPVVGVLNGTLHYYSFQIGPDGTRVGDGAYVAVATLDRVLQRPRAMRGFLNRETFLAALQPELARGQGAWVHGESGSGITSLLRQVAASPQAEQLAHGIVFVDGLQMDGDRDEILRFLYCAFHETNIPIAVQADQATQFLTSREAVFVLDRLPLSYDELTGLADTLSAGAVLISAEQRGPDFLLDVELHGLPRKYAIQVCANTTELDLNQAAIKQQLELVCAALGDMPLALILVNRLLRFRALSLEQVAERLQARDSTTLLASMIGQPTGATMPLRLEMTPLATAAELVVGLLDAPSRAVLAFLVRVGTLDVAALSSLTKQTAAQVERAVRALIQFGLVRAGNDRFQVATPGLRRVLDQLLQPGDERRAAAAFFAGAAGTHADDLPWLAREHQHLLNAVETLLADGRAAEAGALAQRIQPGFVLAGNWSGWEKALELADQAATRSGNRALHAWVCHERGTRAGLIGDLPLADVNLREALRLRKQLGNRPGAALTTHNMDYFGLLPAVGWFKPALAIVAVAVVALSVILAQALGLFGGREPIVVEPTAVPPTAVPATVVPPTAVPTVVPPTAVPPTGVPPTVPPPTRRPSPVLNDSQIDIFAGASTAVPVVQIAALQNDNLAPQSVRITQNPQHGSARPDPETGSIEYSADPNYAGADGLRYEICYTSEPDICGQATLAIAVRQFRITAADDQSSTPGSTGVVIPVLANDADHDGTLNPASIMTSDGPANGSINLNTDTGEITYTPEAGFFDVDSFRYRVCDRAYPTMCATAQVRVQVTRREPVANDDTDIVVIRGRAQILDVLANDLDPDQVLSPGQIDIVSGPERGSR